MAGAALKGGHYKMNIISGVDNLSSDSVVLLMLCTIACNGWSIDIVLQVPQDSVIPIDKG